MTNGFLNYDRERYMEEHCETPADFVPEQLKQYCAELTFRFEFECLPSALKDKQKDFEILAAETEKAYQGLSVTELRDEIHYGEHGKPACSEVTIEEIKE